MHSVVKKLKPWFPTIILIVLLLPFYALLYKLYIPRLYAFGCFDDCFNYIGGYFLLNGERIYSDFFFNHSPLPAYISAGIQLVTTPENVYEFLLRHRQFILVFGFLWNVLLIIRFRWAAMLFIFVFELSKYYVFGDRFLGEAMVVYPIVYMAGVVMAKFSGKRLVLFDYLLSALCTWFVIFSREPYALVALALYGAMLWGKPMWRVKSISVVLFLVFSVVTIALHDIPELFFNLVTVNYQTVLQTDLQGSKLWGPKILHIFFYPLYVFFQGENTVFRLIEVGVSIVFLFLAVRLFAQRKIVYGASLLVILGFANLRPTAPGEVFYESFHMVVWYGLLLFLTGFLLVQSVSLRIAFFSSVVIMSTTTMMFLTSPDYFGYEKVDQQRELLISYGDTMQEGEVVRVLSHTDDTLFLDGSDDFIYWQSGLLSPYEYGWYTSFMKVFPKYSDARAEMFQENPPDFYREFGSCPKVSQPGDYALPEMVRGEYVQLYEGDDPSCLYIHREKLQEVTPEQIEKAREWMYRIPTDETN